MNNYSKIISNMEEKIKNFSKKISKGINTKKKSKKEKGRKQVDMQLSLFW